MDERWIPSRLNFPQIKEPLNQSQTKITEAS
jgi:hypothetical protein